MSVRNCDIKSSLCLIDFLSIVLWLSAEKKSPTCMLILCWLLIPIVLFVLILFSALGGCLLSSFSVTIPTKHPMILIVLYVLPC